jgi:hypothetical protein
MKISSGLNRFKLFIEKWFEKKVTNSISGADV